MGTYRERVCNQCPNIEEAIVGYDISSPVRKIFQVIFQFVVMTS